MKSVALVFTSILVLFAVNSQSGCKSSLVADTPPKPAFVRVSNDSVDTAEPAVAVDADGNVYIAYVEHSEDKTADLFVHKYAPSLNRAGPSVQVNPVKGSVKSWAGDAPTIAVAPDSAILVGWTMRAGTGTNYVLSISRDGGKTFSTPTRINDDETLVSHGMHSLAVGTEGTIYAAWLDERNVRKHGAVMTQAPASENTEYRFVKVDHKGPESSHEPEPNSEVFFASSTDGGKTFSKNQRLASDACPCCKTAVTTDENGRVYVSWRQVLEGDYRHIAVATSSDRGNTFSPRSIVSDDRWQINACPVSGAAIRAVNGELDVMWYTAGSEGQPGYYISRSTNGGEKFEERRLVNSDASTGTPVLLNAETGLTLIYQAAENRTIVAAAANRGTNFRVQSTIEAADNSSAVFANGAVYIAFVRNENKTRSIWITKR